MRRHLAIDTQSKSRVLPLSAAIVTAAGLLASAELMATASAAFASSGQGKVVAVGAENEYANVIAQIGGPYVSVGAIMSNPNTDPHEFEASASVAEEVSKAQLIVQNGVGYDTFMNKIESASHRSGRQVIVAQDLIGVASDAFNPHLWYDPRTMPAVAGAVASDLSRLEPAHAAYFNGKVKTFDNSLRPWLNAIASFKKAHRGTPVAVTEPVADYMLQAAGADIKTPDSFQSSIMNGTDPSPQNISLEEQLLTNHQVKVLLYNQQVTDSLTATFLADAAKAHVPVVGVYETMPTPGYDYQSWMMAEMNALKLALNGTSTVKL
ncbi:MAG TPA: zinc ABC transporter substrate-binding protein [Acidimicrobiales bacterium]|nr:zinc ABC transporter substrate-binding protein [Acidimicrobiales bacterium]